MTLTWSIGRFKAFPAGVSTKRFSGLLLTQNPIPRCLHTSPMLFLAELWILLFSRVVVLSRHSYSAHCSN